MNHDHHQALSPPGRCIFAAVRRLAAVLFLCLPAISAQAQPTFSLALDRDRVARGDPFELVLTVENYREMGTPRFVTPPEADVYGPNQSTQQMLLGSRFRATQRLTYSLVARREGRLVIPALEFTLDGRTVRTQSLDIEVTGPQYEIVDESDPLAPLLSATIRCEESRLFVGQKARFTLIAWVKPAVIDSHRVSSTAMFELLAQRSALAPFNTRVDWSVRNRQLADGSYREYYCLTTTAMVTLTEPGPVRFDGVRISMNYPTAIERDAFRQLRVSQSRSISVQAEVIAPEVERLPDAGRPVNFTGAVGDFRIVATLTEPPRLYRVGDPIDLSVVIAGGGDVESLPGPRLDMQPSLTAEFRVSSEVLAGTTVRDRKIFRHTIRARRADVSEIPPIEYPYFDPQAAEYRVARSAPLPIAVTPGESVAIDDLVEVAGRADQPTELQVLDGLRGNATDERALLRSTWEHSRATAVAAVVVPATAFFALWTGLQLASRDDRASRRRRWALQTARRRLIEAERLSGGDRTRTVEAVLCGYLADRLDQPPARFLGRGALDALRERDVSAGTLSRVEVLLARCEAGAYGGAGDRDHDLLREAESCLSALSRESV